MIGSIVALYAVMDYLAGYRPELVVRLERNRLPIAKEAGRPLAGEAGFGWSPAERS